MVAVSVLFFFKQKTAYEMRIRYWSSDVCSSDLTAPIAELRRVFDLFWVERRPYYATLPTRRDPSGLFDPAEREAFIARFREAAARDSRSEERRVGKESVSTCRSRLSR